MKKLRLYAVTAITIVLASCSKDETTKPVQPQHLSAAEQVMTIIKKADAKLYNSLYGNGTGMKAPKTDVRYLPGVFYIPPAGLDDATCLGTNSVCMVIITAKKSLDPGPDATMITSDVDETYDPGTATLILNDDEDKPTTLDITSFSVAFKGDGSSVKFK